LVNQFASVRDKIMKLSKAPVRTKDEAHLLSNMIKNLVKNLTAYSSQFKNMQKKYNARMAQMNDDSLDIFWRNEQMFSMYADKQVTSGSPNTFPGVPNVPYMTEPEDTRILAHDKDRDQQLVQATIARNRDMSRIAEIDQRNKEIVDLAKSIEELHGVFKDFSVLTLEEGILLDKIEANCETTLANTDSAKTQLIAANKSQKSTRSCLCCVFPVLLVLILVAIIIILITIRVNRN
jgi:t-SNARE complex subunit (syntaxin)